MEAEYVTVVKPRKSDYPRRCIRVPALDPEPTDIFSEEHIIWLKKYANFEVSVADFSVAKTLEKELHLAHQADNKEEAKKLFERLSALRLLGYEDCLPREKWSHLMAQLPGDIGGPNKKEIADTLSSLCRGRVLEAMCGFNSYLYPSPEREVIALDYCREALELYLYPGRQRILFDLNEINPERGLDLFSAGEFNAITICFGFHYLKNPTIVFTEFYRLLAPGGSLLLVENPHQRYSDLACRDFSPNDCLAFLRAARFREVAAEELLIAEDWELESGGRYFLIKAIKN